MCTNLFKKKRSIFLFAGKSVWVMWVPRVLRACVELEHFSQPGTQTYFWIIDAFVFF